MMLGQMIRERRTQLGMTQKQLAQKIGVGDTAISHIERGKRLPSDDTVARLAEAMSTESEPFFVALDDDLGVREVKTTRQTWVLQEHVTAYMEQVWPAARPADIVMAINDALQEYVAGSSWPETATDEEIIERGRSRQVQIGSIILLALYLAEDEGKSGYDLAVQQLEYRYAQLGEKP